HGDISVGAARESGIDGRAVSGESLGAVPAESAGDVEGHDDPVALLERGDPVADLLDDAHVLVTEDDAGFGRGAALVHVQVGAAYRGGGDLHEHIVGMLDGGLVDFLDRDAEGPLVNDGLHGRSLRRRNARWCVTRPSRSVRVTHLSWFSGPLRGANR